MEKNTAVQIPQHGKVVIKDIRYLVFQGGSVKGIAYVGAYEALMKAGLSMQQIEAIAGASAGAITALLLCLGYTPDELNDIMQTLDFKTFLDQKEVNLQSLVFDLADKKGSASSGAVVKNASNSKLSAASSILKNKFGLFEGEVFRNWIEDLIRKKVKQVTGVEKKYLTFAELHQLVIDPKYNKLFKDLFVMGVDATSGYAKVFSYQDADTANVIISDAVRISMSIPFLFMPHRRYVKTNPGSMRVLEKGKEDQLFIDGGVTDNYPIFIFDAYDFLPQAIQEKITKGSRYSNSTVLGFRLVDKALRDFYLNIAPLPEEELHAFFPYFKAVLNAIYSKQESDHLLAQDQWRTVYIDTCGVGMLEFNLSDEAKAKLKASGRLAVEQFVEQPVVDLHAKPEAQEKKISLFFNPATIQATAKSLTTSANEFEALMVSYIKNLAAQTGKTPEEVFNSIYQLHQATSHLDTIHINSEQPKP